jgi:D-alanyl-D-alanine carboxypeptidase
MLRLAAIPLVALSVVAFHATARHLSPGQRAALVAAGEWHKGCPVSLSGYRVLTMTYWGFDDRTHTGQLVVNAHAVAPLRSVFRQLYAMRFPIHHMRFADEYGAVKGRPRDGDITASSECRQASASPCSGVTTNKTTGHWSEHAYGEAVDLNPVENPYVGCGMTRDKTALSYLKRTPLRKGMVSPAVVQAFASAGWGWGGSWSGDTKDYMHFSANGH